ncbi:uncharacterized protein LOC134834651 isoform X2 [Culicoides brevitarsis]|uniref:uncharacterized protein LOC134834651 isoform X2 n=1 Tax=Culicoides brevitarsis TaxID=469753 RepID=UPI00307C3D32
MSDHHTPRKCNKPEYAEFCCQPRSLPLLPGFKTHSGSKSSMECIQTRSSLRSSYNYQNHIAEQTKSLQELQNEVGALLEFRDLVIETFPDLKSKITCSPSTSTVNELTSSSLLRREWEPGIRVRRKIGQKDSTLEGSSTIVRSRSNSNSSKQHNQMIKEPKSGEGTGSVVQDSGFSTETNSSKETHSASSNVGASQLGAVMNRSTEDELWNLLDVIHRKSNRLREEVEHSRTVNKSKTLVNKYGTSHKTFGKNISTVNEYVRILRTERDSLLSKLAEMEAETLTGKIKESKMQNEIAELLASRLKLGHQLKITMNQNKDLKTKLNDLDMHIFDSSGDVCLKPLFSDYEIKQRKDTYFSPLELSHGGKNNNKEDIKTNMQHLDRCNTPTRKNRLKNIDSKKIAFILLENNVVELQRHLLTTTVQNQSLQQKIKRVIKTQNLLKDQLEKSKEDIEDLKFQLEEKNIELEGTRAQLRIIESRDVNQISTPSMKAMTPLVMEDAPNLNHSSSTESAQDHGELNTISPISKQRPPSKIPLPGQKNNVIIKPPSGKTSFSRTSSGPSSNRSLNKNVSSLQAVPTQTTTRQLTSTPENVCLSSKKSEATQSWRSKDVSLERQKYSNASSIPVSSSNKIAIKTISSPVLHRAKRDLTSVSKVKPRDSLSRPTPNTSLNTSNNLISLSPTNIVNDKTKKEASENIRSVGNSSSFTGRAHPVIPMRRISNSSAHRNTHASHSSINVSTSRHNSSTSNNLNPIEKQDSSEVNKVRSGLRANFWNWLKI